MGCSSSKIVKVEYVQGLWTMNSQSKKMMQMPLHQNRTQVKAGRVNFNISPVRAAQDLCLFIGFLRLEEL